MNAAAQFALSEALTAIVGKYGLKTIEEAIELLENQLRISKVAAGWLTEPVTFEEE